MKPLITLIFSLSLAFAAASQAAPDRPEVILAAGAEGEPTYAGVFERWASYWEGAARAAEIPLVRVGGKEVTHLDALRTAVEAADRSTKQPLWLVLLGHGTDDGREPKFNLVGPDLSAPQLAEWLKPFSRPVVIICGFSASGSFVKALTAPKRIVITATRSGREQNFARIGEYLSEGIVDPQADLDKDGATSLLEAWLAAARRTAEFYKNEGRLATEHSLLEDNGDGLGTPADWFQGVRTGKRATASQLPDGLRARQTFLVPSLAEQKLPAELAEKRDALEVELEQLRQQRGNLGEAEYFTRLESILVQLARLYGEPAN